MVAMQFHYGILLCYRLIVFYKILSAAFITMRCVRVRMTTKINEKKEDVKSAKSEL